MQQLESDLDVTQEKLLNANQKLEEKEKALLNAEGEVAALNRHPDARGGSGEVRGEAADRHPEVGPGIHRRRRQPAHVQGAGEQELVR